MLLSALFESQLEVFAQQRAIDVAHVIANGVDFGGGALHENQSNTRRHISPRTKASDVKTKRILSDDLTPFNDVERLVMELADALTETPSNVFDDFYARLRNRFSEEQLMQLGGQIAFENYRACWNRIFDVESDNLYQGATAL
jgi:hypothetical protein